MAVFTDFQRHPFCHRQSAAFELCDLGGIVCQQSDLRESQFAQDFGTNAEITFVVSKSETMIRLNGIKPLVLQRIGAHFVGKTNAATFLIEIQQDASALGPHLRHSAAQLWAAVTF